MTSTNTFNSTGRINITKLPPAAGATTHRKAGRGGKVERVPTAAWPESKLAEAEVEFIDGFMDGHTLRGFTVWRQHEGARLFVTVPQRPYTAGGETKYYTFLFARNQVLIERFQSLILDEYHREVARRRAGGDGNSPLEGDAPTDDPPF